jgi:hypothetical protein
MDERGAVRLKLGYGAGVLIVVLLSFAAYLIGVIDLLQTIALILLLGGVWTVVAAFTIFDVSERSFYMGWGVVIAALSTFDIFNNFNYTIALILIAIVALILINVYIGRTPKIYSAATTSPPAGGGTPAASAV